ncbi:MAG: hypothetical protein ING73_05110 [Rhodocyclaceae bacterium]|nr:hypothetical protein [Rhodocyclaceae bacterium]MCA3023716.1 hypothetical protein [Rhodocyclaceae bacterium]MCA3030371.1 hypothetical protein [Rhodocyclaceae bacterium]MCA3035703.1 hypothetical protein [Rhodocyclaceae bacterium]MCA3045607.1 hypothetical protein [Rhodocyclaceae bacterium]
MQNKFQHLPSILFGLGLCATAAHGQQVRGVNPAEIDSRFDVIAKTIELDGSGRTNSLTLKYDYKLNSNWGLNFELPTYTRLSTPVLSATGNGDFFARARWIAPAGAWTYGASAETVLPTASKDALGTGRYQANVAGLAVYAASPSFILAGVVKQTSSVGGDTKRPSFSNTEVRLVPVIILSQGWAVTGELRQTWEHKGGNKTWQRAEIVANKQFSAQWASSLSYSRDFGDRRDQGAFSLALKHFF